MKNKKLIKEMRDVYALLAKDVDEYSKKLCGHSFNMFKSNVRILNWVLDEDNKI